ncbi:hypothetical protein GWI33_012600 [Rhynchophorus ferrugineus]|uniref:Uncharacterized protein n=1 Tax=Rhynchophorus ferrugineus TaxID=354439 RepID=A0A834I814_RHYFE|nr:hypothetical protein GWI33_012600 [Rhynchophorus ferrugineus]
MMFFSGFNRQKSPIDVSAAFWTSWGSQGITTPYVTIMSSHLYGLSALLARVNMDLGVGHVEFQSDWVPNRAPEAPHSPYFISVIKARIYILLIFYDTGHLLFLFRVFFLLKSYP